jgi:hypothetical protein
MTETTQTVHDPAWTEHIDITPEQAAKWLADFNRHNRPIFDYHWRDLAEDMKAHRFIDTGENGVRFDWDGYICGGQHTLTAIVQSGMTVRLSVTRNVDPAARSVMNDALKQRFAHDLSTMGVQKWAGQIEALTRAALLWDRTAVQHKGKGGLATFRTTGKFTRSTLTAEWPKYAVSTIATMEATSEWNNSQTWPGNRGAMQFMYWLLVHRADCNPAAVEDFFNKICFGSDGEDKIMFLKLRQRFQEDTEKHVQVYWMIKVWNEFQHGNVLTKLQAPKGSINERSGKMILTDPFPRPVKIR